MATQTQVKTGSEQSSDLERKLQELRELYVDAPEIGKTALENLIRALRSGAPATEPTARTENAGRIGRQCRSVARGRHRRHCQTRRLPLGRPGHREAGPANPRDACGASSQADPDGRRRLAGGDCGGEVQSRRGTTGAWVDGDWCFDGRHAGARDRAHPFAGQSAADCRRAAHAGGLHQSVCHPPRLGVRAARRGIVGR